MTHGQLQKAVNHMVKQDADFLSRQVTNIVDQYKSDQYPLIDINLYVTSEPINTD